MKNKKWGMIVLVLLFAGMGAFYSFWLSGTFETRILEEPSPASAVVETEPPVLKETPLPEVYVHVCGEVKKPGVYALLPDSRVAEAVEAAGGFTEEAQETSVNLARKVEDGEQLYVLSVEESRAQGASITAASGSDRVDINTASKEVLMELPGIGEAKAEAIISYRSQHGRFERIEDLTNIEGIKNGVFEKIKDKIKI